MRYALAVIQYPNGRFGFVGSVPRELAVRHRDGRTLDEAEWREYCDASNPALVRKLLGYIEPVFNSRAEAWDFAREAGYPELT